MIPGCKLIMCFGKTTSKRGHVDDVENLIQQARCNEIRSIQHTWVNQDLPLSPNSISHVSGDDATILNASGEDEVSVNPNKRSCCLFSFLTGAHYCLCARKEIESFKVFHCCFTYTKSNTILVTILYVEQNLILSLSLIPTPNVILWVHDIRCDTIPGDGTKCDTIRVTSPNMAVFGLGSVTSTFGSGLSISPVPTLCLKDPKMRNDTIHPEFHLTVEVVHWS